MGRYLAEPLSRQAEPSNALVSRLEDQPGLARELDEIDPGERLTFIHLAARVSVPACEADPAGAYQTNVVLARATLTRVLDWAFDRGAAARVIYVSSGHVYAAPQGETRLTEGAPTAPRSVYARTKLAAEEAFTQQAQQQDAELVIARVFGLIAPRQAFNYVLPGLIERARSGRLDGIPGLDFVRDYLDARDVCENLALLSAMPRSSTCEIVNICSGIGITIRSLLEEVLTQFEPANAYRLASEASAAPGRPDDIRWLVGDPTRFIGLTAARPQRIPLSQTVGESVG